MIRVFRVLPPKIQAWILDHFWVIPSGTIASVGAIALIWIVQPDPYRAVSATHMPVTRSMDTSSDGGFGTAFLIRLPDGSIKSVGTTSITLAQTVVDTACIQTRAHESVKLSYVLVTPSVCE